MSQESYQGVQKPGLVMNRLAIPETPESRAYTSYTFQREDAATEGDPYVKIDQIDTEADTEFRVQGAQRRDPDGTVPVGMTSELSYEVQASLDGQQASAIAERLADLMFDVSQMQL